MRALMVQGTGSNVGKSLLVAGLCRLFARRGLTVRPFKPQNMSNNAAVTADGGEIGRAQALQARAAGVAPSVHMNPVLLKPQSETGSQVVVQGRMAGTARAREYQAWKPRLLEAVLDSFGRLSAEADLVVVEGAGSASEVNLRAGDIANMGFARAAGVPVVLVGDIDRGGVIASLVGTRAVLDEADAAMIRGFIVNRFRGDPALFEGGMRFVAERTGWPALGLVPHFPDAARLPAEDAFGLLRRRSPACPRPGSRRRSPHAADRQFRRPRPLARGARARGRPDRARHAPACRGHARAAAGLQEHGRRPPVPARAGLGHRPQGACAPRRAGAGPVRRLPDARDLRRRSPRHRGSGGAAPSKASASSTSPPS
jgi:dethiobiotin synthetase